MGVPHLTSHLRPFAQVKPLDSGYAVIDGPALAYHVLYLCLRRCSKTSPYDQPSYDLLGRTAIDWLEELQAAGVIISAIYFDGFLPDGKRPTRIQRFQSAFRTLQNYYGFHAAGVPTRPPNRPEGKGTADAAELFPGVVAADQRSKESLPVPAFAVPAILEALQQSARYAPITRVVPGEADAYCASSASVAARMVFTSDSDLLVFGLAEGSSVVFLRDIELQSEADTRRLVAPIFSPREICQRIAVPLTDGLRSVAFEISMDPHLTLPQIVSSCRKREATSDCSDEYRKFSEQYVVPLPRAHAQEDVTIEPSRGVDPRVSELVVLAIRTAVDPGIPRLENDGAPAGDRQLEMWLPQLLDSPSRASAWDASYPTRQLAYSILQILSQSPVSSLLEFRRLQGGANGKHVKVPDLPSLEAECSHFSLPINAIKDCVSHPDFQWLLFSIYEDITLCVSQQKAQPLSLQVLSSQAKGSLDMGSWDVVHLVAQFQATYYSLRMLQQIIDCVSQKSSLSQELRGTLSRLRSSTTSLPSFSGYPTLKEVAHLLQRLKDSRDLLLLRDIPGFPKDAGMQITSIMDRSGQRKRKKNKPTSDAPAKAKKLSNNPFSLLADH